jgi:hypothetical protein
MRRLDRARLDRLRTFAGNHRLARPTLQNKPERFAKAVGEFIGLDAVAGQIAAAVSPRDAEIDSSAGQDVEGGNLLGQS